MVLFSRMTAARTYSYTSAQWSGPGLARCARVRRSPTRSWPTAVRASRRRTISAFPAKRALRLPARTSSRHQGERPRKTRPLTADKHLALLPGGMTLVPPPVLASARKPGGPARQGHRGPEPALVRALHSPDNHGVPKARPPSGPPLDGRDP